MQVSIEVNEEQFKDLLEKELKDLPKETLQEILVQSIKEYFVQDGFKNLNVFLVDNERYGYGVKGPSRFLECMMEKCDYSGLQEVVDKMIDDLKENYRKILLEILSDRLTSGIMNTTSFRNGVEEVIREEVWKMNNHNN